MGKLAIVEQFFEKKPSTLSHFFSHESSSSNCQVTLLQSHAICGAVHSDGPVFKQVLTGEEVNFPLPFMKEIYY